MRENLCTLSVTYTHTNTLTGVEYRDARSSNKTVTVVSEETAYGEFAFLGFVPPWFMK